MAKHRNNGRGRSQVYTVQFGDSKPVIIRGDRQLRALLKRVARRDAEQRK